MCFSLSKVGIPCFVGDGRIVSRRLSGPDFQPRYYFLHSLLEIYVSVYSTSTGTTVELHLVLLRLLQLPRLTVNAETFTTVLSPTGQTSDENYSTSTSTAGTGCTVLVQVLLVVRVLVHTCRYVQVQHCTVQ